MIMTEEDFKLCKFIDKEMCFYTYKNFLEEAPAIKSQYSKLKSKIFYRWYVFSHDLSNKRKIAIWSYLNDDISYEKLTKL